MLRVGVVAGAVGKNHALSQQAKAIDVAQGTLKSLVSPFPQVFCSVAYCAPNRMSVSFTGGWHWSEARWNGMIPSWVSLATAIFIIV